MTDALPPAALELGLAAAASRRAAYGDRGIESRDLLIVRALNNGSSVAEIAARLGMTEQAIYQIRDRMEQGDPVRDQHAATALALERFTDHNEFELAATELLQDLDPSIRHAGGSGDRARDAIGGVTSRRGDSLIVMVSLEEKWAQKVGRELDRIARNGWTPEEVWAVTNRRTTPRPRDRLVESGAQRRWTLRIFDQRWLASRLLRPEHLPLRERLLGLVPPRPPAFLTADEYGVLLARRGQPWPGFVGRDGELQSLASALGDRRSVILTGPGGVGKTRLAIEAARRAPARWVFLDERALVAPDAINEIGGKDPLVVVMDNAHRREDLAQVVGLLERRQGEVRIIFVVRPGFEQPIATVLNGSAFAPLGLEATLAMRPLPPRRIAEILRSEPLALAYDGAVDAIIRISEGNPQLAVLAGELSKGGTPVEAIGADEVLQAYVASLLASVAGAGEDERVRREVLAVAAALDGITVDEPLFARIAALLELGPRGLRRLLADLADAGLLQETSGTYVIRPDLLSEHILWASFFSERWRETLDYREVWATVGGEALGRLVRALGRLPAAAMDGESAALGPVRADLIAEARNAHGGEVGRVLGLVREMARGVPTLAVSIVDISIMRLPPAGPDRDAALVAANEAMERVGDFELGWPRQLAIAAAAFAEPAADETIDKVTASVAGVYGRVPVANSDRDGLILAGVQRILGQRTSAYWSEHHDEPGVADAVAVASRTLLSLMFEHSSTTAENPRSVVMRGFVLPGSEQTRGVVYAGCDLFGETFPRISPKRQVDQLNAIAGLRRVANGHRGPFQVEPSNEVRQLARDALTRIKARLEALIEELSLPVRVEALTVLHDGEKHLALDDTLVEYVLIAHPQPTPLVASSWEDSPHSHLADAERVERWLSQDKSPIRRLDKWADWIAEAQQALGKAGYSPVPGMVLERAALANPEQAAEWLDHLIGTSSCLLERAVPAIAVVLREAPDRVNLARRWVATEPPYVRGLVARAIMVAETDRDLILQLSRDPEPTVRAVITDATRYLREPQPWQIDAALSSAGGDTAGLHLILGLVDGQSTPHEGAQPVSANQLDRMCEIALATAQCDRIVSDYALCKVLRRLGTHRPRLAFEWVAARFDRLTQLDHELRDADISTYMAVHADPIPMDILQQMCDIAQVADLSALLRRLETTPTSDTFSLDACVEAIVALDNGTEVVTAQMAAWWSRDGDGDRQRVRRLLDANERLDWDTYTVRARQLLDHRHDERLVAELITARDPMMWSGSRIPLLQALAEQYATWTGDTHPALAMAGRKAVNRLNQMVEAERAREAEEYDDWEWIRPVPRVS